MSSEILLNKIKKGNFIQVSGSMDLHRVIDIFQPDGIVVTQQYALCEQNKGLKDILAIYEPNEKGDLILVWEK